MSLRFSRVTLHSDEKTTSFLIGGIPECQSDLQGWTAYENYLHDASRYQTVKVHVESFLYGDEELFNATPEEIAYFYKRIERQPDFIKNRTVKIGESDFIIVNI